MLCVDKLSMRFQGLTALDQVSFDVAPGEIHAVIGPNGAGKTTLFNIISGVQVPTGGSVRMEPFGDLAGVPLHRRCGLGIARTFQNIRLFGAMTALENVLIGMTSRLRVMPARAIFGLRDSVREEKAAVDKALQLLTRVGLQGQALSIAATLPYGAQRRLEAARALASDPVLLLLDEPAAGMNDLERSDLAALIRELRSPALSILIVEHDMPFVMGLSDRITVLNFGHRIASGTPAQVRADPRVIAAYLGGEASVGAVQDRTRPSGSPVRNMEVAL
jgi:branched-chain amino acid transport system ATP-binding protein